ncbi:MAG: IS630 family transposase [Spirochaetota bacterium]|nr:IS630 family transposase [Spirochaetota bacterium]
MGILDARSLPSVAQEYVRRKAIKAVLEGKRLCEVADLFGVTRQAVWKWLKAYREGGTQAMISKQKGRPRGGTLLPGQVTQIIRTIADSNPEQLKLPFHLWTRDAMINLIESKFNISLSQSTVGRYLKHWGIIPQITNPHTFRQNIEQIHSWLDEEYPRIRKHAKREGAKIYWGYKFGFHNYHVRETSTYSIISTILESGHLLGCNFISAITNTGRLNFMIIKKGFCADVFIDFLRRLENQAKGTVFLIIEKYPVLQSTKLKAWLGNNSHRIQLFFLPYHNPIPNMDNLLNHES